MKLWGGNILKEEEIRRGRNYENTIFGNLLKYWELGIGFCIVIKIEGGEIFIWLLKVFGDFMEIFRLLSIVFYKFFIFCKMRSVVYIFIFMVLRLRYYEEFIFGNFVFIFILF